MARMMRKIEMDMNSSSHALPLPPWQKEVMVLVALVCLSVCLLVSNITQHFINELQ